MHGLFTNIQWFPTASNRKPRLHGWKFRFPHHMMSRPQFLLSPHGSSILWQNGLSFTNLSSVPPSWSPHMHFGFAWKDLFLLSLPKKYFPPIKAKIKCFQSPSDPSWPFILAHSSALKGFTMCRSKWPEENIQRAKAWVGSTPSFCHHQASVITTSRCLGACCWLQAPVVFSILRVQSLNLRHWTLGFRAWGLNISPASLSPWGWPGRCWFPASEPQALFAWALMPAQGRALFACSGTPFHLFLSLLQSSPLTKLQVFIALLRSDLFTKTWHLTRIYLCLLLSFFSHLSSLTPPCTGIPLWTLVTEKETKPLYCILTWKSLL